MKKIDKAIKQYEPMMYSLLRKFKIKQDYEDMLQLLRIKTWEVLRDKRYKNIYKNKDGKIVDVKLSTYLYKVLFDKLLDILKTDYGVKIKDDGKSIESLLIEKRIFYHLKNPTLCDIPFYCIDSHNTANELKCRLDFELYYNTLSKEDKELIDSMKGCEGKKTEVAVKLKCDVRTIYRRLINLKEAYKKYLIKGEK